ncbi:MAG: anaerobic ribonucleoside-triphosphate reductase [Lactobacillus sp.]|nr:anaerobic ribonucleoside-triphosphate reductase [Lactobacillus sp.]
MTLARTEIRIDGVNFPFKDAKVKTVIKRDGAKFPFRAAKLGLILKRMGLDDDQIISNAISKLTQEVVYTQDVAEAMIQSMHELGYDKEADSFVDAREQDEEDFKEATNTKDRLERLTAGDPTIVNENANKDSDVFSTRRDLTAGTVGKTVGLTMMPEHIAKAHLRGDIHWHDLDYTPLSPMTNCCLIDFEKMLRDGFQIGNAKMDQPHSIGVATNLVAQIIANVASSQYGGCSFDRADEVLAPYAKMNFDKHLEAAVELVGNDMDKAREFATKQTKKDIYKALESLEYQINTMFSTQGQTPFTSVGFGLGTNWFEREIQKDILKIRITGLGKEHRTAIFPKLIFTLKRGLNLTPEDPNYDIKELALECSTKRMYPDVLSYDKIVDITGSFKCPMGCRSFLQGWKDENGKEVNSGRMNLGVVTANLPRIAMESAGDKEVFWQLFDDLMQTCHEALVYKAARVREATPLNAPILYQFGAFGKNLPEDGDIDELFRNKRCTISLGYIGLYEVGTVFYGPNWEHNQEAHDFTLEIAKKMHDLCAKWEEEDPHHYHFSLYSTPSESLTDRFCQLDLKRFGRVKDITDKEYYTNSFHYDVRKHPTPFEKLEFEKDYPYQAAGGFIHYCEYPNLKQNPKALEAVWDFAYDRVGYLGTNTPIDKCYKCGFAGEFEATAKGFQCPVCGNHDPKTCDCVKRTCGYLGNPLRRPMVHGRHEEIAHRVKHIGQSAVDEMESRYE